MTAICQIRSQAQQISLQTWSDKNLITCKDSKMENYFCLAMKEKGWGYYGQFWTVHYSFSQLLCYIIMGNLYSLSLI